MPKIINLAVHGQIDIEDHIIELLDTPELQHLRGKRQTATSTISFPDAVHTRFSHSIGVCHLATKIFDNITHDNPCLFTSQEKELHRKNVQFAALCHDLGHAPWSHTMETVYHKFIQQLASVQPTLELKQLVASCTSHEDLANAIINGAILFPEEEPRVHNIIKKHGGNPEMVGALINNTFAEKYPQYVFLQELIVAKTLPFDADRLDYLGRDPYFTGVPSIIQLDRLLKKLKLHENKFVIEENGVDTLNNLLYMMHNMYRAVYWHHTARKLDAMLSHAIKHANFNKLPGQPILYTDEELLTRLKEQDGIVRTLIEKIQRRQLYAELTYDQLNMTPPLLDLLTQHYTTGSTQEQLALITQLEHTTATRANIPQEHVIISFREHITQPSEKQLRRYGKDTLVLTKAGTIKPFPEISPLSTFLAHQQTATSPFSIYCPKEHKEQVRTAFTTLMHDIITALDMDTS